MRARKSDYAKSDYAKVHVGKGIIREIYLYISGRARPHMKWVGFWHLNYTTYIISAHTHGGVTLLSPQDN